MQIPELILAGPHSIVASIPYIIGFTPHDSLVILWLRDGRVRLTMRLDLPPEQAQPGPWVEAVLRHRATSDEVIVCVMPARGEAARVDPDGLRARALVMALLDRLSTADCLIRDAVLTTGDRWWSYLCEEPECCPPAGTPVDREIADDVAARFALAGVARLPDRQAVVAICAADPARQASVLAGVIVARRQRAARLRNAHSALREWETWRDESITLVLESLISSCGDLDHRDADIILALSDIRVRDTVLWEIARDRAHDAHRAFERAAALLRAAPPGLIAPIGSVTALLAWLIGDGVRATAALDRVFSDVPDYALADLLARSISAGLPPSGWLDMMRDLSREACRGLGQDPAPAA